MRVPEIARAFPYLWHVTFDGAWDNILRAGLLPAAVLHPARAGTFRSDITAAQQEDEWSAILRDQIKSRNDPSGSLDDMTTDEWWRLVNSRVYFFCRATDAEKLATVYLRRGHAQQVLKVRTLPALDPVADLTEVTTVNAGVFPRVAGPTRGRETFVPLSAFPTNDAKRIKEVTVRGRVVLDSENVISVVERSPNALPRRLFP
jgi:hypothetical protein